MKTLFNPKLSVFGYLGVFIVFLLPFVELQCDGRKVQDLNGYQVAFGSELSKPGGKSANIEPNLYVAAALLLTLFAAIVGLLSTKLAAILAVGALVLLFIADPAFNNPDWRDAERETLGRMGYKYQVGYYISWFLLAGGAIYGLVASKLRSTPAFVKRDTNRLRSILTKLDLLSELGKFEDHNITDPILPFLTDEQLQAAGISKVGDRVRLLEEFRE